MPVLTSRALVGAERELAARDLAVERAGGEASWMTVPANRQRVEFALALQDVDLDPSDRGD
ncbi:hypothetical protein [Isoptericola croceus]|uniref:hypothetical protein n=1 Tax=Isoptericola croceus TaxID=3031406 RepID=UPI0023F8343E|nr:hypothetical protein [Isoptericola croceus]